MLSDDKPKSEVKSRAKQRMEDSKNAAEKIKGKRGSHALNTSDKINIMTLSVQRISMDVEVKQIIVLSHASQDSSLKSQIDSWDKSNPLFFVQHMMKITLCGNAFTH